MVIGLIGVLVSAILVAAPALIDRHRGNSTELMLTAVRDMVDQFAREQQSNPTLTRKTEYQKRYGFYPPDELEVFTEVGVPQKPPANRGPLTVGGAKVIPGATSGGYTPMTFRLDLKDPQQRALEHRDNAALVLAIQMFGRESKDMLESMSDANLRTLGSDQTGPPLIFLDRPDEQGKLNDKWDPEIDQPLRIIVDAWGVPIQYFSERNFSTSSDARNVSPNYPGWNEASTQMVRRNGNKPLIVSYGPNGKDQLTEDLLSSATETTSMVGDWMNDGLDSRKGRIDDALNADNIYPDPRLRDRLAGTTSR